MRGMTTIDRERGKLTKAAMDRFQRQGDPLADAVIAALDVRVRGNLLAQVEKRARQEGHVYAEFLDACHRVISMQWSREGGLASSMLP